MNSITALIADDEPLLRAQMRQLLSQLWPTLRVIHEAANGIEAVQMATLGPYPQICFLDIHMPGMSGLDAAQHIQQITQRRSRIVFATAYEEHAIAAFERGAVDYVLKPIEEGRLRSTVERLKEAVGTGESTPDLAALIERVSSALEITRPVGFLQWIKASVGSTVRMIPVVDVQFFHADDKYTRVVLADSEVLIRKPIKELVSQLDPEMFWQIHRATIVNIHCIAGVVRGVKDTADLKLRARAETLTVSRGYLHLFKQM